MARPPYVCQRMRPAGLRRCGFWQARLLRSASLRRTHGDQVLVVVECGFEEHRNKDPSRFSEVLDGGATCTAAGCQDKCGEKGRETPTKHGHTGTTATTHVLSALLSACGAINQLSAQKLCVINPTLHFERWRYPGGARCETYGTCIHSKKYKASEV